MARRLAASSRVGSSERQRLGLADLRQLGDLAESVRCHRLVDAAMAARVQAGELTYTEAVRDGMYTPLGRGDVDIAGIVAVLRSNGFDGWFVIEQDTILDAAPVDEGPVRDVRACVTYLTDVCRSVPV